MSKAEKLAKELLKAISDAELEAANEAFGKRQEWWNARMLELEQQLDVMARNTESQTHASVMREIELTEKVEKLARELEEARKDAERLDYIQKNARNDPKMDGNHVWWPTTFNKALKGPTIRAAIDAAIKEQT